MIIMKLKKMNNNTFILKISDIPNIDKDKFLNIKDKLFNLYGWFPSEIETLSLGWNRKFKYDDNFLFNKNYNIDSVNIKFESKFDIINTNIPNKLYHLSIQEYSNKINKQGLICKFKSKLTSHDYDGRIYLFDNLESCEKLINSMKMFYNQEKDNIIYSFSNPKKIYNKDTKWIIYEIDSIKAGINKLYKDPNSDGYYYLDNIKKESISILKKEF